MKKIFLICCWLAGVAGGPALLARADIVTVSGGTPGAASSFSGGTFYGWSNPAFRYWFRTTNTTVNGLSQVGGALLHCTNVYQPLQVSFMVANGNAFEWKSQNAAYGNFQIAISDGRTNYYSKVSLHGDLYQNGTATLYKVALPYATNWNVTLFFSMDDGYAGMFAGVCVPAGASLMAPALPPQRTLVVLGDSYVKGYIPDSSATARDGSMFMAGFAMDLQQLGSNLKVYPAGVGGQGYVNGYNQPPVYQARAQNDVISLNPEFVLVTGSINDNGCSTNQLFNTAVQLYSTLKTQLPNARIGVIGNWYREVAATTDDQARDAVLRAAAQQCGLPYASPVKGRWGHGGTSADMIHPNAARHIEYAHYIHTNLMAWWGTNWFATEGTPTLTSWGEAVVPGTNSLYVPVVLTPFATNLNVASFGANGDWTPLTVATVSNSPVVTVLGTNRFSTADIGKVIQVFRAGPWITYSNWGPVVTNQDIICTITNVSPDGTKLSLSIPCGWTMNAYCTVGTNNAGAFQAAINTASNLVVNAGATNVTITIPAGRYLMVSPWVLTQCPMNGIFETHPAIVISTGGVTFRGNSTNDTFLIGCGAGMNHFVNADLRWISPGYAPYVPMRDTLIYVLGPIQRDELPLVFENLTFDGGLTNGLQNYHYWTIRQGNGEGWDTTHHCLADHNPFPEAPQMHQLKIFTNCVFQHWRGEILICWTAGKGGTNAFNEIVNCVFQDGNASAINLYYGQRIRNCTFRDLDKVEEYYQFNASLPSVFENNTWSNIQGNAFTIVGARTVENPQPFIFRNNRLYGGGNASQFHFAPAQNVLITSNQFFGPAPGVTFSSSGVQPSDGTAAVISNIVITCNSFNDSAAPISMDGYPVTDVLVSNNTSTVIANNGPFAIATAGWKKNIRFAANTAPGPLDSRGVQAGSYFIDEPSNRFGTLLWDNGWYGNPATISYAGGRLHAIANSAATFLLDDVNTALIPPGARLTVTNQGGTRANLFRSAQNYSPTNTPYLFTPLDAGKSMDLFWDGRIWKRGAPNDSTPLPSATGAIPPAN